MSVTFRHARRGDVAGIVAMLADDALGATREAVGDLEPYLAAFDRMQQSELNRVFVGEDVRGRLVATYQLAILDGLSHRAGRRAQIESVRVASDLRGQGIGHLLMADAEARAVEAGCAMMQLTTQNGRAQAHAFYEAQGYVGSHKGYKKTLTPG